MCPAVFEHWWLRLLDLRLFFVIRDHCDCGRNNGLVGGNNLNTPFQGCSAREMNTWKTFFCSYSYLMHRSRNVICRTTRMQVGFDECLRFAEVRKCHRIRRVSKTDIWNRRNFGGLKQTTNEWLTTFLKQRSRYWRFDKDEYFSFRGSCYEIRSIIMVGYVSTRHNSI